MKNDSWEEDNVQRVSSNFSNGVTWTTSPRKRRTKTTEWATMVGAGRAHPTWAVCHARHSPSTWSLCRGACVRVRCNRGTRTAVRAAVERLRTGAENSEPSEERRRTALLINTRIETSRKFSRIRARPFLSTKRVEKRRVYKLALGNRWTLFPNFYFPTYQRFRSIDVFDGKYILFVLVSRFQGLVERTVRGCNDACFT